MADPRTAPAAAAAAAAPPAAPHVVDLDKYFLRIGFVRPSSPLEATRSLLATLQTLHLASIPFENLDVLQGDGIISMALPDVEAKLVGTTRRGGYCFENNRLFAAVLSQLGFRVRETLARVRLLAKANVRTPLTHFILLVDVCEVLGGPERLCYVDVGFGNGSCPIPIDLTILAPEEQATPVGRHRVVAQAGSDAELLIQHETAGVWGDLVEFTLRPYPECDFMLSNWYSCSAPAARMVNNLVVSRMVDGHRYQIVNFAFTIKSPEGVTIRSDPILTSEQLIAVLQEQFFIDVKPGTVFTRNGKVWPLPQPV